MSKTHFKEYSIGSEPERKSLVITDFLGVDFSESQINVDDRKATDMVNMIDIDGVNQVRDGFETIANIPSETYTYKGQTKRNTNNINAIWTYKGRLIIHVGVLLYVCESLQDFLNTKIYMLVNENDEPYYELENYKSKAFLGKNGLYILGGNGYYILYEKNGDLIMEDLADNETFTYIPTTLTAVTSVGSGISNRNALDDINLLTQWQKNKLISGHKNTGDESFYTFELSSPINPKNIEDLNNIVVSVVTTEGE